jgi:hypothetical protein
MRLRKSGLFVALALVFVVPLSSSSSAAPIEPVDPLRLIEPLIPPALRLLAHYAAVRFPDSLTLSRAFEQNVVLVTPVVNRQVTASNYFLLSFWYNATSQSAHTVIFRAEDPGGNTVAELAFDQEDITLTLQVDYRGSFRTMRFSSKTVQNPARPGVPPVQLDGQWHNVIVNAHMTGPCLTEAGLGTLPCCAQVEFQIDGGGPQGSAALSLMAMDTQGNVHGATQVSFGPFVWSNATKWSIGGPPSITAGQIPALGIGSYQPFFRGMLAEFYLQLDDLDLDPPTPLITDTAPGVSPVTRLINRLSRKAVNLNPGFTAITVGLCSGPTGNPATMCHTGNPFVFLQGAGYTLSEPNGAVEFATSDPCAATVVINQTGCK